MKHSNDPRNQIEASKPLDRKKVLIRLAVVVILFAISFTFLTIGLKNIGKLDEGLQRITAPGDENVPLYQLGVTFEHYFSGSSSQIRQSVRQLEEIYAIALKDAYRILDPVNTYEGWANLATVNQNLGREVTVNRELYTVLKDALRLMREGADFNLFSGVLYSEWESLRYLLEPGGFDPAKDPDEAIRLEKLTAATSDLSHFSLELLDDAAYKVRLTVDQDYLDLLAELELTDAPILDLNVLKDAYKLQLVAARLAEHGYDRGYLLTDTGILLTLPKYQDGGYFCIYGQHGEKGVPAATVALRPNLCAVQLRSFGFEGEPGYYVFEADGKTLLRHPNLPADGLFREVLLTGFVCSENWTPAEACAACLHLFSQNSEAELMAAAKTVPAAAALMLRDEPNVIWTTDAAILPLTDYGYTVQTVQ